MGNGAEGKLFWVSFMLGSERQSKLDGEVRTTPDRGNIIYNYLKLQMTFK